MPFLTSDRSTMSSTSDVTSIICDRRSVTRSWFSNRCLMRPPSAPRRAPSTYQFSNPALTIDETSRGPMDRASIAPFALERLPREQEDESVREQEREGDEEGELEPATAAAAAEGVRHQAETERGDGLERDLRRRADGFRAPPQVGGDDVEADRVEHRRRRRQRRAAGDVKRQREGERLHEERQREQPGGCGELAGSDAEAGAAPAALGEAVADPAAHHETARRTEAEQEQEQVRDALADAVVLDREGDGESPHAGEEEVADAARDDHDHDGAGGEHDPERLEQRLAPASLPALGLFDSAREERESGPRGRDDEEDAAPGEERADERRDDDAEAGADELAGVDHAQRPVALRRRIEVADE